MVMVQRAVAVSRHCEVLDCGDFQMRQASTLLTELLRTLTNSGCRVLVVCAAGIADVQPLVQVVLEGFDTEPALPSNVEKRTDGPMTARERSVLRLICQGLSNKKIARDLHIAPETVKSHTKHILCKLGTNTRAQAVAQAAKLGLL